MRRPLSFSYKPILASCAIGIAVASLVNLIVGDPWLASALKGGIAGTLIGSVAEYSFIATARWINRKPIFPFIAVILVIAAGTSGFIRFFMAANATCAVAIVAISEIAGITATAIFWRYSKKMNDRLKETKKHFTALK
jgi:hypothetical protein